MRRRTNNAGFNGNNDENNGIYMKAKMAFLNAMRNGDDIHELEKKYREEYPQNQSEITKAYLDADLIRSMQ